MLGSIVLPLQSISLDSSLAQASTSACSSSFSSHWPHYKLVCNGGCKTDDAGTTIRRDAAVADGPKATVTGGQLMWAKWTRPGTAANWTGASALPFVRPQFRPVEEGPGGRGKPVWRQQEEEEKEEDDDDDDDDDEDEEEEEEEAEKE
ncbi:unnamed protein product [Protopolystoma xenopodis]|uniref:Uncharacterized protein n=1 Tax=Protopolystoma xenopodis TaxID=117903 RepID=A0A3S5B6T1_9PLAT|nr:unnamed protein product [Protopolystoma xenopodis]